MGDSLAGTPVPWSCHSDWQLMLQLTARHHLVRVQDVVTARVMVPRCGAAAAVQMNRCGTLAKRVQAGQAQRRRLCRGQLPAVRGSTVTL
jgi:hypothetical protein